VSKTAQFYRSVWEVVRRIPRGRVASYGAVARAAGFPGLARQVVWALRGAPHSAGLPWHRVVGAGGRILLPAEAGLDQQLRLQAEGVRFAGSRVRMDQHNFFPAAGSGRRLRPKRSRSVE
jgi:methylated-DNA-protein-cysteine methyltransferase-like protein